MTFLQRVRLALDLRDPPAAALDGTDPVRPLREQVTPGSDVLVDVRIGVNDSHE
jgi:hypothetical protein